MTTKWHKNDERNHKKGSNWLNKTAKTEIMQKKLIYQQISKETWWKTTEMWNVLIETEENLTSLQHKKRNEIKTIEKKKQFRTIFTPFNNNIWNSLPRFHSKLMSFKFKKGKILNLNIWLSCSDSSCPVGGSAPLTSALYGGFLRYFYVFSIIKQRKQGQINEIFGNKRVSFVFFLRWKCNFSCFSRRVSPVPTFEFDFPGKNQRWRNWLVFFDPEKTFCRQNGGISWQKLPW